MNKKRKIIDKMKKKCFLFLYFKYFLLKYNFDLMILNVKIC